MEKNNKYLIVLGRGIEGCGNTRNAIELENYLKSQGSECHSISVKEIAIGRGKAHVHNIKPVKFVKDFGIVIAEVDWCDRIVVISVPPKKCEKEVKDNFLAMCKHASETGKKMTYLQFDHRSSSICRNMYTEEEYFKLFDYFDTVVTHSYTNDFVLKFLKKNNIACKKLVARDAEHNNFFSIDFEDVKSKHWKPFEQKEKKSLHFLGRSAAWKGPWLLKQLHMKYFKPDGYITYLEGLEISMAALDKLFSQIKPKKVVADDNILVQFSKDDLNAFNNGTYEFKRDMPAYVLPPYFRDDGLEHMSKSMFGIEMILLDDNIAKDMIENSMLETVACGTMPVVRKHWADVFTVNGKSISELGFENTGIICLDENDPKPAIELMDKLQDDKAMYDKYRNIAYEFYKSIFDNQVILKQLKKIVDEA